MWLFKKNYRHDMRVTFIMQYTGAQTHTHTCLVVILSAITGVCVKGPTHYRFPTKSRYLHAFECLCVCWIKTACLHIVHLYVLHNVHTFVCVPSVRRKMDYFLQPAWKTPVSHLLISSKFSNMIQSSNTIAIIIKMERVLFSTIRSSTSIYHAIRYSWSIFV